MSPKPGCVQSLQTYSTLRRSAYFRAGPAPTSEAAAGHCAVATQGRNLYRDDHHLSTEGALNIGLASVHAGNLSNGSRSLLFSELLACHHSGDRGECPRLMAVSMTASGVVTPLKRLDHPVPSRPAETGPQIRVLNESMHDRWQARRRSPLRRASHTGCPGQCRGCCPSLARRRLCPSPYTPGSSSAKRRTSHAG